MAKVKSIQKTKAKLVQRTFQYKSAAGETVKGVGLVGKATIVSIDFEDPRENQNGKVWYPAKVSHPEFEEEINLYAYEAMMTPRDEEFDLEDASEEYAEDTAHEVMFRYWTNSEGVEELSAQFAGTVRQAGNTNANDIARFKALAGIKGSDLEESNG